MAGSIDLTIPNLTTPGPEYAQEINTNLAQIASHTHDGVDAGASIDIAAQECLEDLSIDGHNLAGVRSVEFENQPGQLTGSQDVNCLYVNQNNLGFNNDDGIFVPITAGNNLAPSPFSSITNWTPRSATITANFSVLYTDTYNLININSAGGAITGTLPIAAQIQPTAAGRFYIFRDVGRQASTHNITIQVASGSGNTFGDSTSTTFVINNSGGYVGIYTDGVSKWWTWTQNVFNSEILSMTNGTLTMSNVEQQLTNGSLIIGDNTAGIELQGALIMASGSGTAFEGTATCAFVNTSVCSFSNASQISMSGGTTFTSSGIVNCSGQVNISGGLDWNGAGITGTANLTGTLGGTSATISFNRGSTITNGGSTNLYGVNAALTLLSAGTYNIDSGTNLDFAIGVLTAATGAWVINLPASPSTGRTIRVFDVTGFDPDSSTYTVALNGNGHSIGMPGEPPSLISSLALDGGFGGFWSVDVMFNGTIWNIVAEVYALLAG